MQYKVPQNIDIEDKVIAGLTLRQFMFLMIAGGIVLILKYALVGSLSFLFLPISVLVGGLGIALAFVRVNDRPFEVFLVSAAKTILTPKQRVWKKDVEIEIPHPETAKKIEAVQKKRSLGEVRSSLEKLATIVDSGGAHEANITETHMTNVRPREIDDTPHLGDVLAQTEEKHEELSKIMSQAKVFVDKNKKEATVGEISTVQAKPTDYKYEQIETADEKKLEEILEKAHEHEKEMEEKLASAKIEKHVH